VVACTRVCDPLMQGDLGSTAAKRDALLADNAATHNRRSSKEVTVNKIGDWRRRSSNLDEFTYTSDVIHGQSLYLYFAVYATGKCALQCCVHGYTSKYLTTE
jgi:hypothetical protein